MLRRIDFLKKNKKGVSIMIGYVLLISLAVVMGTITYQWIKTYVPKEEIKCPEGVSLFVENLKCDVNGGVKNVSLTLKNNGRFNIDGYFIKSTNLPDQELATIDISNKAETSQPQGGFIIFPGKDGLETGKSYTENFILDLSEEIYLIEILPAKVVITDNKRSTAICSEASVREKVSC